MSISRYTQSSSLSGETLCSNSPGENKNSSVGGVHPESNLEVGNDFSFPGSPTTQEPMRGAVYVVPSGSKQKARAFSLETGLGKSSQVEEIAQKALEGSQKAQDGLQVCIQQNERLIGVVECLRKEMINLQSTVEKQTLVISSLMERVMKLQPSQLAVSAHEK